MPGIDSEGKETGGEGEAMSNDYELIIIGGGPAGLTAGIYASRARRRTVLLEKQGCGGQMALTWEVENYPGVEKVSGFELGQRMEKQARGFGLEIRIADVQSIAADGEGHRLVTSEGDLTCRTLIIASGSRYNRLSVPGESELTGKGVSYCATCDGAFFRDVPEERAVAGGAVGDPLAGEFRLAGHGEAVVPRTGGDDESPAGQVPLRSDEAVSLPVGGNRLNVGDPDLEAESARLLLHPLAEFETGNLLHTRIILHFPGERHLSAAPLLLQKHRSAPRPGRIYARRQARRPAADDDQFVVVRHGFTLPAGLFSFTVDARHCKPFLSCCHHIRRRRPGLRPLLPTDRGPT